jgi:purine-nucleoside phosphorylase
LIRDFFNKVDDAVQSIRDKADRVSPRVGIILGSGLSGIAKNIPGTRIRYKEIKSFPSLCISGQSGILKIGDECAVFAGRFHYYQGYKMADVVLPVFILHELGAELLILTNAAGGINPLYKTGELVLIKDHINRGVYEQRQGNQFPDMSSLYGKNLRDMAKKCVSDELKEGVYAGVAGPNYETPAEVRMLKTLGADMVGMSTVPEAIAAASLSMDVLGISCIVNPAAGIGDKKLSHKEVAEAGEKAAAGLSSLLINSLKLYYTGGL